MSLSQKSKLFIFGIAGIGLLVALFFLHLNSISAQTSLISNLVVNDSSNAGDWSIQTNLQNGYTQYGDRDYKFTYLPSSVIGSEWVRTANDSKTSGSNPLVTFTVNSEVIVYLAHDDRVSPKPSWMSGWTDTALNITNSDSEDPVFSLYYKSFSSNQTVSLGPNSPNNDTSPSMYTIMVKESQPTTITPTAPPDGNLLKNLLVYDSGNANDWSIQSNLQSGDNQYGDRSMTFTLIPSSLLGSEWIRTANDSKTSSKSPLVNFQVNAPATVYIAHDDRVATKPAWMGGWFDTGMEIKNSDWEAPIFSIYYRNFLSNQTISLGPNGSGSDTNPSMYTIIVTKITPTPTPTPTPKPNPNSHRMPSTTFSYGDDCGSFKSGCPLTSYTSESNDTQVKTSNDFFLKSVDNGYGGKVNYEYWTDSSDNNALEVKYCDTDIKTASGQDCRKDHKSNTQRHRVKSKTTEDGMGNSYKTDYNYTGSGASEGLAYVTHYQETWTVDTCSCDSNPVTYCDNPLLGNDKFCSSPCDWEKASQSCCPNQTQEYLCTGNDIGCGANQGKTNRACICKCKDDKMGTNFSGYEFLGYPEVETTTYEKNSSSNIAAKTKTFYFQAMSTSSCFKPSPLKGTAYKVQTYDADNRSRWQEQLLSYKVRFGDMFGTTTDKADADINSYCTSYDPKKTTSLVLQTQAVNKSYMPNPSVCTKSTTSYDNLDGSKDVYANVHQTVDWGRVSCANTTSDDTSDKPRYSLTNYTAANSNLWILPKPDESWMSDSANGTKYKHSRIYYDNQSFGQLGNLGQATKNQTLMNGSVYAESTLSYSTSYPWQVVKSTDALGRSTTTNYDSTFRIYPVSVTNPAGQTVSYEYDFNTGDSSLPNKGGNLAVPVKTTDMNGKVTSNVYDSFGRLTETYLPGKKPGSGVKPNSFTKYYYFNSGDISPCNEANNCLSNLGKQIGGSKGPKMMVYQATRYDDSGGVGKVSGTHTYYDGIGQTVQTRKVWYENELANAGVNVEGEGYRDLLSSQTYSALGQIEYKSSTYTASPYSSYSSSSYDTRDFVGSSSIDKTRYIYDGFGRQTETRYADGTRMTNVYDVGGNPLNSKQQDRNCNDSDSTSPCVEKETLTDAFGQVLEARQKDQSGKTYTTKYAYQPILGLQTQVTDTLGNIVSKIEYDSLGRKTKLWDIDMSPSMSGDNNSWRYSYDKADNLTLQTDPKGNSTQMTYDPLDRMLSKTAGGTKILERQYDNCTNGKGRVCTQLSYNSDGGQQIENTSYVYDDRGRVTRETKTLSGMPDAVVNNSAIVTEYSYDVGGRIASTKYQANSNLNLPAETLTNSYVRSDVSGINTSLGGNYVNGAVYNKNKQLIKFNSGNGVQNSYTYRGDNLRLTSVSVDGGNFASEDTMNLSYDYDASGNIKKITDNNNTKLANGPYNFTQQFTYDPLERLKSVSGAYSADYNYDDIGNILTKNEGGNNVTLSYSNYSGGFYHRPQSASGQTGNYSYTYDQVGNMTGDGEKTFSYDADNRMIGASGGGEVGNLLADIDGDGDVDIADYTALVNSFLNTNCGNSADLNGDCLVNVFDYNLLLIDYGKSGGTGVHAEFVYDGSGQRRAKIVEGGDNTYYISPELEIVIKSNGTKSFRRNYYFEGKLVSVRENSSAQNSTNFVHQDHLGSSVITSDSSGNVIAKQSYYPYGATRAASGIQTTERQYTGQVSDVDETGLYYYNARYYNPQIAKFTQADTVSDSVNRYRYANNNPVISTDPTGHQVTTDCGGDFIQCLVNLFGRELFNKGWPQQGTLEHQIASDLVKDVVIPTYGTAALYFGSYAIAGPAGAEIVDLATCAANPDVTCIAAATAAPGPNVYGRVDDAVKATDDIATEQKLQRYINEGVEMIKEERYEDTIAHFSDNAVLEGTGISLDADQFIEYRGGTTEEFMRAMSIEQPWSAYYNFDRREIVTIGLMRPLQKGYEDMVIPRSLYKEFALGYAEEWYHALQHYKRLNPATFEEGVARYLGMHMGVDLSGTRWVTRYGREKLFK